MFDTNSITTADVNYYVDELTEIWTIPHQCDKKAGVFNDFKSYCVGSFLFVLFDLILYIPSTIFQLNRDGSTWVEPVLSWDKCVLLKDHNTVTPVRLEPTASRSRVKHYTLSHCAPFSKGSKV